MQGETRRIKENETDEKIANEVDRARGHPKGHCTEDKKVRGICKRSNEWA